MQTVALKITDAIRRNVSKFSESDIRKINFGLQCILGELFKFTVFFIVFLIFSVAKYYLIAVGFYSFLRVLAGGYHADTFRGCFIISFLQFLSIVLAACYLSPKDVFIISILLLSIVFAVLFSPVDHPNKPIVSPSRRKKMRYFSIGAFIGLSALSLILPEGLNIAAVMAIFFEAVSLPFGVLKKGGT